MIGEATRVDVLAGDLLSPGAIACGTVLALGDAIAIRGAVTGVRVMMAVDVVTRAWLLWQW